MPQTDQFHEASPRIEKKKKGHLSNSSATGEGTNVNSINKVTLLSVNYLIDL